MILLGNHFNETPSCQYEMLIPSICLAPLTQQATLYNKLVLVWNSTKRIPRRIAYKSQCGNVDMSLSTCPV